MLKPKSCFSHGLSVLLLFSNLIAACPAQADFVMEKAALDVRDTQAAASAGPANGSAGKKGALTGSKLLQGHLKQIQADESAYQASVKDFGSKVFEAKATAANSNLRALHPFTAQMIAKTGAAGIQQTRYPNCWLEASLAAVAAVPNGQRVIAEIITQPTPTTFAVAFPVDNQPVYVTLDDLSNYRVRDRAQWAAIVDCAAMKRFPDNDSVDGPQFNRPKIKTGLELLTGVPAQFVRPDNCSDEQLRAIIEQALSAKVPIVMASKSPGENGHLVQVVTPNHAYTIMHYDPGSETVTLRNPYGCSTPEWAPNADQLEVKNELVRDLGQGLLQMNLKNIKYYFRYVAWSCR